MAKKYAVPRVGRAKAPRYHFRSMRPEEHGEASPWTKPSLGDRGRGTRSSRQGGRAMSPRRRRRRGMKNGRPIPNARDLRSAKRNQERAAKRRKERAR